MKAASWLGCAPSRGSFVTPCSGGQVMLLSSRIWPVFVERVGDEELHRDQIAREHMPEGEVRPLLRRMEIHVDLGEQYAVFRQHALRPHHFAHPVMGPGEEGLADPPAPRARRSR